ncbi:MAG: hypothetical protein A3F12_07240 [Gammaproteobacteria bacterium RIFCSPHIGHO2_12_FULL_38_14]|nr:MAG: hypothetical protein A3F12_07240 [Gammaproteobacteria bacterium RIFCSPHIGHO2_12_FULL_38_14]
MDMIIFRMLFLYWIPMLALAVENKAVQADSTVQSLGLGRVMQNMLDPLSVLSDFIQTACFVIGGSFIFASFIKYIEHRRNPLMVPISTVVLLLIMGIVLVLLPFLSLYINTGMPSTLLETIQS